jgi:60 kDa SS-A/Ro ribonucleoprotein
LKNTLINYSPHKNGYIMATINKLIREYTHEGSVAIRIDLVSQLERSVMSCLLWEDESYEDGISISKRIADLVSKVPAHEVARITIQAKEDMRLRHIPLLLAVELCKTKEGKAQLKLVLPKIITRADDITEFLSLYWRDGKKPLAKQVKLLIGAAFRKFDEYALAKYNGGSKAIKLRDAMKMTRPKPSNKEECALWRKLIKDELITPDTWEVAISTTKDKKSEWERLISGGKLGGLAMLRNIRNMRQAGVENDVIIEGISRIDTGRLLPINFISAAKYNPQFELEIEKKFFECFAKKERVSGKTIILVDVSGSMIDPLSKKSELTRMDVACSLAMIGREIFETIAIVTFSDKIVQVPQRRGFALRDAIIASQIHRGTYLGVAVQQLYNVCDRLIVITDEQCTDNVPDHNGYIINVFSNKNGVGYRSWLHINGWSDKVLDYIIQYEKSIKAN